MRRQHRRLGHVAAGATLLALSAGAFSAQQRDSVVFSPKDVELLESLIKLPQLELGDERRKRFEQQLNELRKGLELAPARQQETQREVEQRLKPVPITQTGLAPQLPQVPFDLYESLSTEQQLTLIERSRSVARVEIVLSATESVPQGTAFVVGDGLMATNCHVWSAIASADAQGNWTPRAGSRVHFADSPAHDPGMEFAITGIAGFSTVAGLDVAVIRVSRRSLERDQPLPSPLPVRRTALSIGGPASTGALLSRVPIALVGYPNVARALETNFAELRSRGQFAKIYSPGMVLESDTVGNVGLLYHVASTTGGSSGSPIFATDTFEVIGVHSCCTAAGAPRPVSFPCSQILRAPINRNVAISTTTLTQDRQLTTFFVRPPA